MKSTIQQKKIMQAANIQQNPALGATISNQAIAALMGYDASKSSGDPALQDKMRAKTQAQFGPQSLQSEQFSSPKADTQLPLEDDDFNEGEIEEILREREEESRKALSEAQKLFLKDTDTFEQLYEKFCQYQVPPEFSDFFTEDNWQYNSSSDGFMGSSYFGGEKYDTNHTSELDSDCFGFWSIDDDDKKAVTELLEKCHPGGRIRFTHKHGPQVVKYDHVLRGEAEGSLFEYMMNDKQKKIHTHRSRGAAVKRGKEIITSSYLEKLVKAAHYAQTMIQTDKKPVEAQRLFLGMKANNFFLGALAKQELLQAMPINVKDVYLKESFWKTSRDVFEMIKKKSAGEIKLIPELEELDK